MSDTMSKVIICRNPFDDNKVEVDETCIRNVRWDDIAGGIQMPMPMMSLYGYMPYEAAMDAGVSISGMHAEYYNDAKVCIVKKDNTCDEEHEAAYCRLVVDAECNTELRHNQIDRTGTWLVSEYLKNHVAGVSCGQLKDELEKDGYDPKSIQKALRCLKKAGYLQMQGSVLRKNTNIALNDRFPYLN